jgi:hypothetical protein
MIQEPEILSPAEWCQSCGTVGDVVAVDFETYYTSAYSVKELGHWAYCHDPRFEAYLVAVTDGERTCVCDPRQFPWATITGRRWVSHNRDFDRGVFERLRDLGVIASTVPRPSDWFCTAALCAYLQHPRDLAGAVQAVFGQVLDKAPRSRAKGWNPMEDQFLGLEMRRYAGRDALACLALWNHLERHWPASERRLFELTSAMGRRGLAVDWDHVRRSRQDLQAKVEELSRGLPWEKALSVKAFRQACDQAGVRPPTSTSAKDPGFLEWADTQPGSIEAGWALAMQRIRSANRTAKVLEAMEARRMADGRMAFELRYFGATTGRWAGGGGLNLQNLNRGSAEGVDVRRSFVAPPGHVLAVVDYSQIESRVLLYLAGDTEALRLFRDNPNSDAYEIHARRTMGYAEAEPLKDWCDRTGSNLRQLAKARCVAGTTPILTDRGYFTATELQRLPNQRVWDGENWVRYERAIRTGLRKVRNYGGEHFTPDHRVFLDNGEARPIGEIFGRAARESEGSFLRRSPPGGEWADIWRLARFVIRTLAREWSVITQGAMRRLRAKFREGLLEYPQRALKAVLEVRKKTGSCNQGQGRVGKNTGCLGSSLISEMGRNDATLLRPALQWLRKIWRSRD